MVTWSQSQITSLNWNNREVTMLLHRIAGIALMVVMAGLIASGLTYKFAKPVPIRKLAKKIHLALAYGLMALLAVQVYTVL
jgi:hypothetical protein